MGRVRGLDYEKDDNNDKAEVMHGGQYLQTSLCGSVTYF